MLALDPKETWDYTLTSDQEKSNPPRFILRHISFREYRACLAVAKLATEAERLVAPSGTEGGKIMDEVCRIVHDNLVEIRDAPTTMPAELEAALTLAEFWELFWVLVRDGRLADADRKNSRSPAPGRAGDSAESAPATLPSAGISPEPQTQSNSPGPAVSGQSPNAPSSC